MTVSVVRGKVVLGRMIAAWSARRYRAASWARRLGERAPELDEVTRLEQHDDVALAQHRLVERPRTMVRRLGAPAEVAPAAPFPRIRRAIQSRSGGMGRV